MTPRLDQLLDREITRREAELAALKQARQALSAEGTGGDPGANQSKRGRRNFSPAQRAAISKRMKATWARRRAAKKAGRAA